MSAHHTAKTLLNAAEILHAHAHGPFHERLLRASRLLFEGSVHSFEMYRRTDGTHFAHTDAPFPESRLPEIVARIGELVPRDNPIFPYLVRGESRVLRLTDLVSQRQFHRTDLYHDIFRGVELTYQMVIPASTDTHAGALTINRGTRDYSDGEVETAAVFARHLKLAFETDRLLRATAPVQKKVSETDFTGLRRLGLTHRESEILWWMSQGKRDRETAIILGISPRTVNHHAASILRKLRVETRVAAVSLLHKTYQGSP